MSVWPPQNTGLFDYKLPCCGLGCECALDIYSGGIPPNDMTPFADEASAADIFNTSVIDCMLYFYPTCAEPENISVVAIPGSTQITKAVSTELSFSPIFSIYLTAGDLVIDYVMTVDQSPVYQVNGTLWDDTWASVDSFSSSNGSDTFTITVPASGCYYIDSSFLIPPPGGPTTLGAVVTLTNPGSMIGRRMLAHWDDGIDTGTVGCTP